MAIGPPGSTSIPTKPPVLAIIFVTITLNGPGFLETFQGFQRAIRDGKSKQFCHNLLRKHCHCEIYAIPYCDVGRDHDGADDDGEGGDHDGGEGRWKGWPASFDGASCRQVGPGPV